MLTNNDDRIKQYKTMVRVKQCISKLENRNPITQNNGTLLKIDTLNKSMRRLLIVTYAII
jgi:hypothetical protein